MSQGGSDTLEFKTAIPEPILLARLIASFANARGGKIVVGVKEPAEVVGIDESNLRRTYEAAFKLLTPTVHDRNHSIERTATGKASAAYDKR